MGKQKIIPHLLRQQENPLSSCCANVCSSVDQRVDRKAVGKPDGIAGVATGGIAWARSWLRKWGCLCYVGAAKSHGTGQQVEGDLDTMRNVVVIEDLISTGKSSLNAVAALREANLEVKGLVAIFSYGFDDSVTRFDEAKCAFEVLTDYPTMLEQALSEGYITKEQASLLESWSSDPVAWSEQQMKA